MRTRTAIACLTLLAARVPALSATEEAQPPPQFAPLSRSVSNWGAEASAHLGLASDADKGVTRCVRLNNYWCVKGLRWNGMIAADGEGHAAFASAVEGAAVAALLLRRYYRDYGRKSAQAIVARWAPAQCGVTASRGAVRSPGSAPDALSTRGIGQTLRARWIARGRGKLAKLAKAAPRPSSLPPMMRAPSIAVGLGEAPVAMPELKLASLAAPDLIKPSPEPVRPAPARPAMSCASEANRIAAYARNASAGVADSPEADLALFTAEGEPTPNLARVMENMSAVEIGPLRASKAVVEAGIARAMEALHGTGANGEP